MFAHVTRDDARVGVLAAAGGQTHRDANRLAGVKVRGSRLRTPPAARIPVMANGSNNFP